MFSIEIEEKNGVVNIHEDGKFLCFFQKRDGFNAWRLIFGGDAISRLKELGMLVENDFKREMWRV